MDIANEVIDNKQMECPHFTSLLSTGMMQGSW